MAIEPITAVADLANTVISRLWPDKTAQEQAQMAAALTIVQGQLEINKVEAGSSSVFTSGWRPFIGWVCGLGCAWNWIGLPAAKFGLAIFGNDVAVSPGDLAEMLPLLFGMLGLGGLRTVEKINGVAAR